MGTTVEIPGGHAVLRSPTELKVRHRRLIEEAALAASGVLAKLPSDLGSNPDAAANVDLTTLGISRREAAAFYELQDATIVAVLESWTLTDPVGAPLPIPTMDTVGDLDPPVYDALAVATREAGAAIARESNLGVDPDPKALTQDSSDSNGLSPVEEKSEPEPSLEP